MLSLPAAERLPQFHPFDFTNCEQQPNFFRVRVSTEGTASKRLREQKKVLSNVRKKRNDKLGLRTGSLRQSQQARDVP